MSRRKARLGRYLPTLPAAPFVSNMPPGFIGIAGNYDLTATTRPYLTMQGAIRVRLVFRGRGGDHATMVVSWTLGGRMSAELREILEAAIGPGLRIRSTRAPQLSQAEQLIDG